MSKVSEIAGKKKREVVTFVYNDLEYTVRKKMNLRALEALEQDKGVGFLKAQLGLDQWDIFVKSCDNDVDSDDVDGLAKAMLDAMGVDRGK